MLASVFGILAMTAFFFVQYIMCLCLSLETEFAFLNADSKRCLVRSLFMLIFFSRGKVVGDYEDLYCACAFSLPRAG